MFKPLGLAILIAASASGAAHAQTVRIGLQPWLGYGPLWVAEKEGFFEARGVDVQLTTFNWDQDMTAALASGNLDVIAGATNGMIANFNQGVDQKGFLIMDVSFEADAVLAGGGVTSIADLRGKSVAYEAGATSDLLINYALRESGMTLADIEHVPMGASEAGLALIAGRVDAAVTYEPYISTALAQEGDFKVLYTAAERPGLISDMLTGSSAWISANPEAVSGLILAWDDAVKFIRANPEEGGAMIAEAVGSPMEEFAPAFAGVRLYDLSENKAALAGDFQSTLADTASIMQSVNPDDIKTIPSADDLLALDAINALQSE